YVSTAAFDTTHEDARAIADQSAASNAKAEITGAMAFNGTNFAQVLEGPTDTVHRLLECIKSDGRHSGTIVVSEHKVGSRKYRDWGMKFISGPSFDELLEAMHDADN
ncbi:MAG: BLUF domain-containing protein, partial [Anderseniella sp.]|nr:BLUF domain-containing protein [Anderseniella sp.]